MNLKARHFAAAFSVLLLAATAPGLRAQTREDLNDKTSPRWKTSLEWQARAAFDDNVFLLRDGRKNDLNGQGQFLDMDNAADFIGSAEAAIRLRGRGLGSRRLLVRPRIGYDLYTQNPKRSHAEFGISAVQSLTSKNDLSFEVQYTPSAFQRTYLIDGGPRYAPGVYRQTSASIGLARELTRKKSSVEADGSIAILFQRRTFENFAWRNRDEVGARAGIDLKFNRMLSVDLIGGAAVHSFNPVPEPIELGDQISVVQLRRDRTEVEFGIEPRVRLGKDRFIEAGYRYRLRSYHADLQDDPVYGGRDDRRNTLSAAARFPVARHLALRVGGMWQVQNTSQPGRGETGDEADYSHRVGYVQIEYPR